MVNDLPIRKKKRLLVTSSFFILLFLSQAGYGQKLSKHYVSYPKDSTILYFIYGFGDWKNKASHATLTYDLTYETSGDSLTFNFTYADRNSIEIDSLAIRSGDHMISAKTGRLFVDIKKNKFQYRYTTRFPFKEFKTVFIDHPSPVEMVLTTHRQQPVIMTIDNSQWEKQRDIIRKVLTLIEMNSVAGS
jgi:hypothetical protein